MKDSNQRTILQLVLIDETGDSYHRMRWPGRILAEQAKNWRIINLDARAKQRLIWSEYADLLVIYQSSDHDLLPVIAKRRAKGLKTLVEYNDNFYEPPPASPVAKAWTSPLIWQTYERFMHEADGLLVTGPRLKQLFSEKTDTTIHVLENQLSNIPDEFDLNWRESSSPLVIGWAGSLGHLSDLLAFLPKITEFIINSPGSHLRIMGNEAIPSFVRLPDDRISFTPWGTMEQYYDFLKGCHIGIAPLLDTPYNRCRSDVKAIEISSQAALPLLPNLLPYRDFLTATDLPSFSSADQLYQLLRLYWSDRKLLKDTAAKCYQYVLENRIAMAQTARLELYSSLLPKQAAAEFKWPFGAGYFEVQGDLQAEAAYVTTLKTAQGYLQAGKLRQALQLLEQEYNANPLNPELLLALLKCSQQLKARNLPELLSAAQNKFPADLRFALFAANTEERPQQIIENWGLLLQKIHSLNRQTVNFFARDIITIFCQQFTRFPIMHPIAEKLLQIFPASSHLQFCLAEYLFASGKEAEAINHYYWLKEQKQLLNTNQRHLSSIEENYLNTLIAALEARLAIQNS